MVYYIYCSHAFLHLSPETLTLAGAHTVAAIVYFKMFIFNSIGNPKGFKWVIWYIVLYLFFTVLDPLKRQFPHLLPWLSLCYAQRSFNY